MSVLITAKFQGDTAKFRQALAGPGRRADEVRGPFPLASAIHHRFGVGDGFVLVVDEWATAEQFQQFMANPDLQAFIGQMGAVPAPPEVTITDAVASPDQF